jgi:hypothetical protein
MGIYPQMNKGVSKLQYDSFIKTGTEAQREGFTHSLPSSHKNVNQSAAKVHQKRVCCN